MGPSMGIEEKLHAQLAHKDERIKHFQYSLTNSAFELRHLHERVEQLETMIAELRGSASFKLAQEVARAFRLIAPPETGRRRALHLGFRGLRNVPKLRDRRWVARKLRLLLNESHAKLRLVLDSARITGEKLVGPAAVS